MSGDSRLIAVPVRAPAQIDALELGLPVGLFNVRLFLPLNQQFGYAVDSSGQNFLIHMAVDETPTIPITIVQNWTATLRN